MKDKNNEYELIKLELLKHNFVVNQVLKALYKRISKLEKSFFKQPADATKGVYEFRVKIRPKEIGVPLEKIAKLLKISPNILQEMVKSGRFLRKVSTTKLNIIDYGGSVISKPGIYARYEPSMSQRDWIKLYKEAQKVPYIDFYYQDDFKNKGREQIGPNDIRRNIGIYLKIEKAISEYYADKKMGKILDMFSLEEDKKVQIVTAAIEKAIGDKVPDNNRNKLFTSYKKVYYSVAKRYKLPTIRKTSKFLKILDGIPS
jgi:hypothetical protein